jgi:hypothetical protein
MKRENTEKDLFVDCNPSWDGMNLSVFYSSKFSREASFKAKLLLMHIRSLVPWRWNGSAQICML